MEGEAAGDDLHVAGCLDKDDTRLLCVECGVHGVGRGVEGNALGNGDAKHLVRAAIARFAEGDGNDLVGHGARARYQLCSRARVLSNDQCFHECSLCLSCA